MVQIGNIHVGRGSEAEMPRLDASEAYALFNALTLRYDLIHLTQIYLNFVHDPDFLVVLKKGMSSFLEEQVNLIENQFNTFKLVMPRRAPKSVNTLSNSQIMTDELIFRHMWIGMQYFMEQDVRHATRGITNDSLRDMFTDFVNDELKNFGNLTKYGKLKGWFETPPMFLTS